MPDSPDSWDAAAKIGVAVLGILKAWEWMRGIFDKSKPEKNDGERLRVVEQIIGIHDNRLTNLEHSHEDSEERNDKRHGENSSKLDWLIEAFVAFSQGKQVPPRRR